MKNLGELLSDLSLPDTDPAREAAVSCDPDLIHDLGADLPAGHLHLWGGPRGAGKTSFLLSLLYGAASSGRRVLYATYHLPAQTLAIRVLGMAARVDVDRLAAGDLTPSEARRAAAARECLSRLPVSVLEARGMGVASLEDRVVRMPFRAEIMAVEYLQAIIRAPGVELGGAVRGLSSLASRLHLAVVAVLEGSDRDPTDLLRLVDRAGWIAPAGGPGLRRAEVIRNRYGGRPAVPLELDPASGLLRRIDAPAQAASVIPPPPDS